MEPKRQENEVSAEARTEVGVEHPVWTLLETQNSFTLTPLSPICVQASLTIDKSSLKAQEHGKFSLKGWDTHLLQLPRSCNIAQPDVCFCDLALTSPGELRVIS